MTTPDYTSQHRVTALKAAVALATYFETPADVLACAETFLAYLTDGSLPQE